MASSQRTRVRPRRLNDSVKPKYPRELDLSHAGTANAQVSQWIRPFYSYLLLALLTVLCLAPFSGRAFHIDDTLFLWAAQHIVKQPLNPYGFDLIWDMTRVQMSDVTQNPPLASYYAASIGALAGWSEPVLHLWFLLPALAVVLATYRLAQRITKSPLLAALCTLLTPGFLVSASSVMCDTLMLAFWMLATVCWFEGEDSGKPVWQIIAGVLIGASALTKYYGAALVPLLFVYSLKRRRHIGTAIISLSIPAMMLLGYEYWTADFYGSGLISRAGEFADAQRDITHVPAISKMLVGASFAGGCALTAAFSASLLWSRKLLFTGIVLASCAAALIMLGWIGLGVQLGHEAALPTHQQRWALLGVQLAICIGGGISILALAVTDFWKNRNAESFLLTLWVLGTFVFSGFLNWTVNARSVLPLIPATGILLARRISNLDFLPRRKLIQLFAALIASGVVSLWVAAADARLANDARQAAQMVCNKFPKNGGTLWFEGHWGFQYYMESCGARPTDIYDLHFRSGDWLVIPENNVQLFGLHPNTIASIEDLYLRPPFWATTTRWELGAGFYSALWGPLPYVIAPVPSERYKIVRFTGSEPVASTH